MATRSLSSKQKQKRRRLTDTLKEQVSEEWRSEAEIVDKASYAITPEKAARRWAIDRKRPPRRDELFEAVRFGVYRLIQIGLYDLVRRGVFERKAEGNDRFYRIVRRDQGD